MTTTEPSATPRRQGGRRYVVVTPAFNERGRVEQTIECMLKQTTAPTMWMIVDDHSTDGTWEIIQAAAARTPWIECHRHEKAPDATVDGLATASEARAFLQGLERALECHPDAEYVVKLDADLTFAPDYFETVLVEFDGDPQLGIAGGTIYEGDDASATEASQEWHVRGATKVYRRRCYSDIGGIRPVMGWDGLDEVMAHHRGWTTRSLNPPTMVHLRPTAGRHGRFRGGYRSGQGAYYLGYSAVRTAIRGAYRMMKGDVSMGAGLVCGYGARWLRRAPRIADVEVRRSVDEQQWRLTRMAWRRTAEG